VASELVKFGFDFPKIIEETFYEKTYVQNQIMGRALLESILFMDGRCIVAVISKEMMNFYGVTGKDLDGIINQMRNTKGVECAIFLYELDNLEYKVSMRSGGRINVSAIAQFFGGGGHVRAAGCTVRGTAHDVINNISAQIELQYAE
jgi:phosphoesterase RecJ-like protein